MILKYKDIKIFYKIKGKGQDDCPLLFLHGWEGSTLSFKYFYDFLSKKRKCIVLDFPPFGKSEEPKEAFDLNDYSQLVILLLQKLNVKKVDLVAHSFGGRVSIFLASQTEYVNKMLLTGCAGINKKSFIKFIKVKKYKCLKFLSNIKLYPKEKLEKMGSSDYKKLSSVMKETFNNIITYDQTKQLSKINAPTLLVWGSLDKETPFYFTKIFKKHIKDCEIVNFKNCSHFAYLERPNLFLKILLSYFC